jgi:hypothetical protein
VNGLGCELLAGAAFPDEQDRRRRRRDAVQLIVKLLHYGRAADHVSESAEPTQLLAQVADFGSQLVRARDALQDRAQAFHVYRLHDVIGGTRAQRIDRALDGRMACDHDDFGRVPLFEVIDQLYAVTVRQLQVGQQHIGPHLRELNARGAQ